MRRLLVTGGAGFIGTNFVHYWIKRHPQDRLVVLDALTYAGNLANLDPVKDHPSFRFVHGNICDDVLVNKLFEEERFDTVVHFAAESHVDRSITGPDAFIQTNIVGTHVLLKASKRVWLDDKTWIGPSRFHHVSTDEVYGSLGPDDLPFTEETPYAPNSPYSASKAASDHLVRAYHHTYSLDTTVSNCSNNYGPYQFPEKLIPLCIVNLLNAKPLPIYGDGKNIRDWLHVEDHCRGIELILEKGKSGETYNIGGNNECNNLQLVETLCTLMDERRHDGAPHKKHIQFVEDRLGHDRRYAINTSKIKRELGFPTARNFTGKLSETITWYLLRELWWRPLLSPRT